MKVEVECAACLLHRGYLEVKNATNDLSLQFKAMSVLADLLSREFKPAAVPAVLGTERDRLVKRVTGNSDPYAKTKQLSNRRALEILPLVKSLISRESSTESGFRKACLCSIVGNVIEFDIPVHAFKFEDMEKMIQRAEEDLAIDEIPRIFNAARKARRILYLTDNAGEIAFDTLFVHELKKLGAHVVVGVKDKPILNDATMGDAEAVGMHKVADSVITTGTDSVGLIPEECSQEFFDFYSSVDFVVAKGMGYLETISEFQSLCTAHAFLLRTKCGPVARFLGVDVGKNVAMLRDISF
ncbi:MAG: hypothetical protein AOA65_1103 [Candidatus Bathyarchaeota archaeon BA1]|nr:MAG: hypothetical protein AOA65_1103 [Candidatus Bathyarchaeota archaeon BA1]